MAIKRLTVERDPELEVAQLQAQLFEANATISNLEQKLEKATNDIRVEHINSKELEDALVNLRYYTSKFLQQGGLFFTSEGYFVRTLVLDPPDVLPNSKIVVKPKWLTLTGLYRDPQSAVQAAIESPVLSDYISSFWPELELEVPEPVVEPDPVVASQPELEAVVLHETTGEESASSGVDVEIGDEDLNEDPTIGLAPWSSEDEMVVYLDSLVGKQIKAKRYFIQPEDKDGGYSTGIYLGSVVDEASGRTLHKIKRVVGSGGLAKVKATVIVPETIRPAGK